MTEHDLQEWMRARLAYYLNVNPQQINLEEAIASYGLDSSVAVTMTVELSELIQCDLDPAFLFWEYPTIQEMAGYLYTNKVSK